MNKVASTKKKVPAKGTALKKAAPKKIVLKKTNGEKTAVKKSLLKKAVAKKIVAKKPPARKAAQNKIASKKPFQKKPASKTSAAKKTAIQKKMATKIVKKKAAPPKKAVPPQRVIKKTGLKVGSQKTATTAQRLKLKPGRGKLNKTVAVKNVTQKKKALKTPTIRPGKITAKKSLSGKKSSKKSPATVILAPAEIMMTVNPSIEKMVPERHVFPIRTAKVHSLRAVVARLSRVQKPLVNRTAETIASLVRAALPNARRAKLPFMKKIRQI